MERYVLISRYCIGSADSFLVFITFTNYVSSPFRPHTSIICSLDFGESHHIGPVSDHAAQPGSHAWVDGLPHTPWLRLCALFARAFRRSARPALAQTTLNFDSEFAREDRIFAWARPHPRDAIAHQDSVGRPRNWELVSLNLFPHFSRILLPFFSIDNHSMLLSIKQIQVYFTFVICLFKSNSSDLNRRGTSFGSSFLLGSRHVSVYSLA